MLGVHHVSRDGADYYLSDFAREVPVSAPGQWVGVAAAGLGLQGPVDPAGLRAVLEGRHPRRGRPMGSGRTSVAGFDLTFSAPKSVSVVFALGGADAARSVVTAHAEAVSGALSYMEQHGICAVRRSGSEREVIPTSGAVAALFTHAVNRNRDPHLHSHVVVANLVHGDDGRWSACDARSVTAHRQAASAVYEAQLRAGLSTALQVRWSGGVGRTSEIAGVSPHLLGEFSSRAADIRRRMYDVGARSPRGRRVAWAATRRVKESGTPYGELAAEWRRRARAVGGVMELERAPRQLATRPVLDEHRFAAIISVTPHGGARRRDVVAAFGAAAQDGITACSLERLVAQWVAPGPVGVAEPVLPRGTVVPPNHVLSALGPRPVDPADHEVWVGAARAIDAYRQRWGTDRAGGPLGVDGWPKSLASVSADRLADHLRTARHVDVARVRLGRRSPVEMELGRGH
jgi:conjugative relaxase-like TrwC/TraI family protein